MGMELIFACTVASQIHTGADLLAACRQVETTACDAFILSVVESDQSYGPGCIPPGATPTDKRSRRESVAAFIEKNPRALKASATRAVADAFRCDY